MEVSTVQPFYQDWTFWSLMVSGAAVILSQIPPIRILIKPKRLDVEVHDRVNVTHKVGNPNFSFYISLGNSGGRSLRITGLKVKIQRDNKDIVILPAQYYFESPSDQTSVLFVPFSLKPEEYWSHKVNFLNFFDRATEKLYRDCESALRADIQRKIVQRGETDKNIVVVEPELVDPFYQLFNKLFIWEPGEYIFELIVDVFPLSAAFTKKYRFTLFESDAKDLKAHADDYKFGGGFSYNVDSHIGLFVPITEHKD